MLTDEFSQIYVIYMLSVLTRHIPSLPAPVAAPYHVAPPLDQLESLR